MFNSSAEAGKKSSLRLMLGAARGKSQ